LKRLTDILHGFEKPLTTFKVKRMKKQIKKVQKTDFAEENGVESRTTLTKKQINTFDEVINEYGDDVDKCT
jgi:hypothetical protein